MTCLARLPVAVRRVVANRFKSRRGIEIELIFGLVDERKYRSDNAV